MNERPLFAPLPKDTIKAQRDAANPDSSTWVEANAGSGKTRVLTDRVLRLLLEGVPPDRVLCLTYTKAAAAEMRQRVSDRLAAWARLEPWQLADELADLGDDTPTAEDLARARTLFATALETPGGLKIQTIHAFCESVLHRFPVEAGVPIDFKVVDDFERDSMLLAAREQALAAGINGDPSLAGPVETLFDALSDFAIAKAIDLAMSESRKLKQVLADRPGAKRRLRRLVGHLGGDTSGQLRARIAGETLLSTADCRFIVGEFDGNPAKTRRLADYLARANLERPGADDLIAAFLTGEGEPRASLMTKQQALLHPQLCARLETERERIHRLCGEMKKAALVERSEALLDVLGEMTDRYENEKRSRSLLDFDDLVAKVSRLLHDSALGPWVRYKLDGGLTHILVDESQDTNPEQWAVVDALVEEFFQPGDRYDLKTLFAVGDAKQSIYSFQGAEPKLFQASGLKYRGLAREANRPFREVRLNTSFRTLAGVLDAVDQVFAEPSRQAAVLEELAIVHRTARRDPGGVVTLWPPVRDLEDDTDPEQWPLELPRTSQTAARQVAERIGSTIARWIHQARPLGARQRPVRPGDVLILVQSRSSLFHEVIRALHLFALPTQGADRLGVTGHIAVLDLMALGDVLLNPAEDLQLAALLRSPLFGLAEDTLYALAEPRPPGQSLWEALRGSEQPAAASAFATLARWRGRLDFERPYEFFAHVLQAEGGLRLFHRRFGGEVDDVIAEFLELALAHEQLPQPSLQGFLAAMRSREVMIKRELSERGGGVRVMTVHGAKGLEAPIVILADAASRLDARQTSRPVYLPLSEPGPLLVHASSKADHVPETLQLRDAEAALQQAEYWRKLYVAMTRAEDELYVTGALTKQAKLEGTWYEAVEGALGGLSEVVDTVEAEQTMIFPRVRPAPAPILIGGDQAESLKLRRLAAVTLPPLPRPRLVPVVRPSSASAVADPVRALETGAGAAIDAETARRQGLALHAMLQHLPEVPAPERQRVALQAAATLLPEAVDRQPLVAARALSILARPELSGIFGPDSRAEVPFLGEASRNGEAVTIAGRIDRLVVTTAGVLVVDFKSDANPSPDPLALQPAYLTQMGLYALLARQLFPGLPVTAAILWTELESLLVLPESMLGEATRGFTMR